MANNKVTERVCGKRCYACSRILVMHAHSAFTPVRETVIVGPECYEKIVRSGSRGYLPQDGKPRLFCSLLHLEPRP